MKLFIKVEIEGQESGFHEVSQEIVNRIYDLAMNWDEYNEHRDEINKMEKPKTVEELIENMLDDITDVWTSK